MTITAKAPDLGQMLEEARREKGLSIERAAAMVGVTSTTWRGWKRGQVPSLDNAPSLIRFTGRNPVIVMQAMGVTEEDISTLRMAFVGADRRGDKATYTRREAVLIQPDVWAAGPEWAGGPSLQDRLVS